MENDRKQKETDEMKIDKTTGEIMPDESDGAVEKTVDVTLSEYVQMYCDLDEQIASLRDARDKVKSTIVQLMAEKNATKHVDENYTTRVESSGRTEYDQDALFKLKELVPAAEFAKAVRGMTISARFDENELDLLLRTANAYGASKIELVPDLRALKALGTLGQNIQDILSVAILPPKYMSLKIERNNDK